MPQRIKEELTKACTMAHQATTPTDIANVLLIKTQIENCGFKTPCWFDLLISWKQAKVYLTTEEYFNYFSGIRTEEISAVNRAVRIVMDEDSEPLKQALYAISNQVLLDHQESEDGLSFEFHCKRDEYQKLSDQHNFSVFKKILERESAFWQYDLKIPKVANYNSTLKPMPVFKSGL